MVSSVASSRIRNQRAAQIAFRMRSEEVVRTARLAQDLIDEEELELEEQEAAEDAELMLQAAKVEAARLKEAAKAKANMSRARREVERKRFEINASRLLVGSSAP